MRETLFILGVIVVLLVLTAVRYRRTIVGMISFTRALNEAKRASRDVAPPRERAVQLVKCAECGINFPKENALFGPGERILCSRKCLAVRINR